MGRGLVFGWRCLLAGGEVVEGRLVRFLLITILSMFDTTTFTRAAIENRLISSRANRPLINTTIVIRNAARKSIASVSNCFGRDITSGTALLFGCINCGSRGGGVARGNTSISLNTVPVRPSTIVLGSMIVASSVTITHGAPITMSAISPMFVRSGVNSRRLPRVLGSAPNICTSGRKNNFNSSGVGVHNFGSRCITVVVGNMPVGKVRGRGMCVDG